MDEIVKEIIRNIKEKNMNDDSLFFNNENYKPIKISIEQFNNLPLDSSQKYKTCYVDGGNCEILASSTFSLNFIRLAAIIEKKTVKKEFYCFVNAEGTVYKTKIFPASAFPELVFNFFDKDLKEGNQKVSISLIGSLVRRLAELDFAAELIKLIKQKQKTGQKAHDFELIVLDGTLESKFDFEKQFLNKLYEESMNGRVIVSALSKTCSLTTKNGNSATALLNSLKKGTWYYHQPIPDDYENYTADLYFLKLNKNSDYVFRFDVFRENKYKLKYEITRILSELESKSKDPLFLGYPYQLITADKIARVSNKEAEYLRVKLITKFKKDWNTIKLHLKSIDAHSILDSI